MTLTAVAIGPQVIIRRMHLHRPSPFESLRTNGSWYVRRRVIHGWGKVCKFCPYCIDTYSPCG